MSGLFLVILHSAGAKALNYQFILMCLQTVDIGQESCPESSIAWIKHQRGEQNTKLIIILYISNIWYPPLSPSKIWQNISAIFKICLDDHHFSKNAVSWDLVFTNSFVEII